MVPLEDEGDDGPAGGFRGDDGEIRLLWRLGRGSLGRESGERGRDCVSPGRFDFDGRSEASLERRIPLEEE